MSVYMICRVLTAIILLFAAWGIAMGDLWLLAHLG